MLLREFLVFRNKVSTWTVVILKKEVELMIKKKGPNVFVGLFALFEGALAFHLTCKYLVTF